jgi:hypothetical protein
MNRKLSPQARVARWLQEELEAFPALEGREPNTADIDAMAKRVVDCMVPIFRREQLIDMAYEILEEKRQGKISERSKELDVAPRGPGIDGEVRPLFFGDDGAPVVIKAKFGPEPVDDRQEAQAPQQSPPPRQQQTPRPPQPRRQQRPTPPQPQASGGLGGDYGKRLQEEIERGMTPDQKRANRDKAFREVTQLPMTREVARGVLPGDWRRTTPAEIVDEIERAARRHDVPIDLLARLIYQEGKFGDRAKLDRPIKYDERSRSTPQGVAQLTGQTVEQVKKWAEERGDHKRVAGLEAYQPRARELAFDIAAEYLSLQHRRLGSWAKAAASYNVGLDAMGNWFAGTDKYDPMMLYVPRLKPGQKWREMTNYLAVIFRGGSYDSFISEPSSVTPRPDRMTPPRISSNIPPNIRADTRRNP